MRILALDPGGTTGWAYVDIIPFVQNYIEVNGVEEIKSKLPVLEDLKFHYGQFNEKNHHDDLYRLLHKLYEPHYTVVSESFEYRNASRPGLELISVEYIGVAKLFCERQKVPLILQTASMGKVRDKDTAFIKPSNLKKLGLWSSGQGHAMDALGHLLYYMIHNAHLYRNELLTKGWKD